MFLIKEMLKQPYIMHSDNDCGPRAIAACSGISYEQVIAKGWPQGFAGNDDDMQYQHQQALLNLGLHWRKVSLDELLAHTCKPYETLVLGVPMGNSLLQYHWMIYGGRAVSNPENFLIYMGDVDKPKMLTPYEMKSLWQTASYAYELTDNPQLSHKLPWYKRLWNKLTGWIK